MIDVSDEEKMMRNIAIRGLLNNNEVAIGPDGQTIPPEQLLKWLDPSVDHLMYKSKMEKVAPDGTLLCDDRGRPLEKNYDKRRGSQL